MEEGEVGRSREDSTEQESSTVCATKVHVGEVHCETGSIRDEEGGEGRERREGSQRARINSFAVQLLPRPELMHGGWKAHSVEADPAPHSTRRKGSLRW